MADKKAEKCAHPVCSCLTKSGKYCSSQCEAMEKTPDIDCSCGHRTCTGNMRTMASATIETPPRVYHRTKMRNLRLSFAMLTLFAGGVLAGCFGTSTKSPEVSDNIR